MLDFEPAELESCLLLASRLKVTDVQRAAPCREVAIRVSKMLRALIRSIEGGPSSTKHSRPTTHD